MNATRTCAADGCDRKHYCKGFCTTHYQRWRKHGDPMHEVPVNTAPCIVEGCDQIARTLNRTLCPFHYDRHKNGRSLTAPVKPMRAKRGTCTIDDCDQLDDGPHGLCPMHSARKRRHGDPLATIRKHGEEITYSGAHRRMRRTLGSATMHHCVDCGGKASQWSYTHADPDELREGALAYSVNPEFYVPRCVSCHVRLDRWGSRA